MCTISELLLKEERDANDANMLAAVARPGLRANSDETSSRPRTSFPAAHRRPATASHARPSTAMLAAEERRMLDQQPTLQHRAARAGLLVACP